VFDNATQIWNRTIYRNSMKPGGGGKPTGALRSAITHDFRAVDGLLQQLGEAARTHFSSGWAWLVEETTA
jgi:superoxide dismutase, Fe-Mn family